MVSLSNREVGNTDIATTSSFDRLRMRSTEMIDQSVPFGQSAVLAGMTSIRHGFFNRQGGRSEGAFSSNNMSIAVGDTPHLVEANRYGAVQTLGYLRKNLYLLKQVHSATIRVLTDYPDIDEPFEADAMVTNLPALALGILTADCTPILFADAEAGIVGAAHAGWRGAANGICEATIRGMVSIGASIDSIAAAIGPTISGPNYEVGPQFAADLLRLHPTASSRIFVPSAASSISTCRASSKIAFVTPGSRRWTASAAVPMANPSAIFPTATPRTKARKPAGRSPSSG